MNKTKSQDTKLTGREYNLSTQPSAIKLDKLAGNEG